MTANVVLLYRRRWGLLYLPVLACAALAAGLDPYNPASNDPDVRSMQR